MLDGQRIQVVVLVALYVNLLLGVIIISFPFSGTLCYCAGVSHYLPQLQGGVFIKRNEKNSRLGPCPSLTYI